MTGRANDGAGGRAVSMRKPPPARHPPTPPGYRPWRQAASPHLAVAPPHWVIAAPPRVERPAPPYRAARVVVVVAATCGLAAIARAQVASDGGGGATTGATTGTTTGGTGSAPAASDAATGSLRAQVQSILPGVNQPPAGPTTTPAWTITPGISLQEEWTDNALQTPGNKVSSLITVVAPSISINGATSRLTASLYYSPSLLLYTPESSQNQIGQNLGGNALLTVAPEEFYVQATGFAAVQSLGGAIGPYGSVALNQSQQIQTYNFAVEPYFTHRFGGWGSLQVGAMASQTSATPLNGGPALESLTTRQEFANFSSGENFGRTSHSLQLSAVQMTGTGILQGAADNTATYQVGYAITHDIIALASIGWENINYGGGPGSPRYNDATWSVGTQLTPNADSSITVSYGHQQGATSAALNASYAPTATIRLFAQYAAGVTSGVQSLNTTLTGASFDANGHPINSITGEQLSATNNFFGFNPGVYMQRSLALSASWLLPRDTFQATVQQISQTPVGNAFAGPVLAAQGNIALTSALAASSGTTGTLSWQHDLSAVTSLNGFFQYGVLNNYTPLVLTNGVLSVGAGQQVQNATLLAFGAGVTWQMTKTLTGTLQYSYTNNDYGTGNPGVAANLVVIGLQKTF